MPKAVLTHRLRKKGLVKEKDRGVKDELKGVLFVKSFLAVYDFPWAGLVWT